MSQGPGQSLINDALGLINKIGLTGVLKTELRICAPGTAQMCGVEETETRGMWLLKS